MQSYTHLTTEERTRLQEMHEKGMTKTEIGKILGKHRSTITRELKRNGKKNGGYNWWWATSLYIHRRKQCRRPQRIENDPLLMAFIHEMINKFYSPFLIVLLWKKKHPESKISPSTIYRAVNRGLLEKVTPKTHFRRKGRKPRKRSSTAAIKPLHTIHDRPEEANKRTRNGDWEGDLIIGKNHNSALLTLIDRRSRTLFAKKIANKEAQTVEDAIVDILSEFDVRSITLDRGSEFANFQSFEKKLKTTVYFADPRSPWQRGSNENINGLLRFFFPKITDFSTVSDSDIESVLSLINDRPRKCLNWLSPIEVFSACCT